MVGQQLSNQPVFKQKVDAPLKDVLTYQWQEISRVVNLNGNGKNSQITFSTSTTITKDYTGRHIFCSGTISITLPSAVNLQGVNFFIFNTGVGTITVVGTINGAANFSLSAQYKYVEVESNGTNWYIVRSN